MMGGCRTGVDTIGLMVLDWAGLGSTGLDWIQLAWAGLESTRPDRTGLDCTGLDWAGVDWVDIEWTGLEYCTCRKHYTTPVLFKATGFDDGSVDHPVSSCVG